MAGQGFFYVPPPTFVGGRQPYAPPNGLVQSGIAPQAAPNIGSIDSRVLNVLLRSWLPDVVWVQGLDEMAPISSNPSPPAPGPVIPISVAQQMALRMAWEPPYFPPPMGAQIAWLPTLATAAFMPNLVGLSLADAQALLAALGLQTATSTTGYSVTIPPGSVISQNPVAGAFINDFTPISVVVSIGPFVPSNKPPPIMKVTTRTFNLLELVTREWGSEFRAPDHRVYTFGDGKRSFDSTDMGQTGIYKKQ